MFKHWKKLVIIIIVFLGCYYLPVGNTRFENSITEALHLVKWYAREHVLLCLVPAFFIVRRTRNGGPARIPGALRRRTRRKDRRRPEAPRQEVEVRKASPTAGKNAGKFNKKYAKQNISFYKARQ